MSPIIPAEKANETISKAGDILYQLLSGTAVQYKLHAFIPENENLAWLVDDIGHPCCTLGLELKQIINLISKLDNGCKPCNQASQNQAP